jgi:hypothetical protein
VLQIVFDGQFGLIDQALQFLLQSKSLSHAGASLKALTRFLGLLGALPFLRFGLVSGLGLAPFFVFYKLYFM